MAFRNGRLGEPLEVLEATVNFEYLRNWRWSGSAMGVGSGAVGICLIRCPCSRSGSCRQAEYKILKAFQDTDLKVLFLTKYPPKGASSRYRVYQYLEEYEAAGLTVVAQSFMTEQLYDLSLSSGHQVLKFWLTLIAICRRLGTLWRHRDAQVFYLQRELFPLGPPVIEHLLKRWGKRIVFDYDDALFINKPSRYNWLASFFRSPRKTERIIKLADLTVAGNNWLRDQARIFGGRAVTVEVAEDTERYLAKTHDRSRVTIGWLGSPSTSKYLHTIADQLRSVARDRPEVEWAMVGGGDFCMQDVSWKLRDWSLQTEQCALFEFDIGLMPLPDEDWSLGKSGGKARTYMAAGVVPVVSAIGYNFELVEHQKTGVLIHKRDEWAAALIALIDDPEKRKLLSQAARQDVKRRFSVQGQAAKIAQILKDLGGEG